MNRPAATAPRASHGTALYLIAGFVAVLLIGIAWQLGWPAFSEQPQMRVGLVTAPENEPIALARARGALDPRRVSLVEFCSFEDLRNAFLDGNVHAGVFALDDAVRLSLPPVGARIEHFVGVSRLPLLLLGPATGPGIGDLRGRCVGLESGAREAYALRTLLAGAGCGPSDVSLDRVDADSGTEGLAKGFVSAVMTYPPDSDHMVRDGAKVLAAWRPGPEGEMYVLIASARAHRLAREQIEYFERALRVGAAHAQRPDSADLRLVARREEIDPARAAALLGAVRFLSPEEDRRLRSPAGRDARERCLDGIRARWRALGIPDSVRLPALGTEP